METEPLQDTLPPRHQVESDESEDEDTYPLGREKRNAPQPVPVVQIEWLGPEEKHNALVVTSGEAGHQWLQGIKLGEAKGRLITNGVQTATIYTPDFADVFVVRLELRLPLYTIHPVTSMILGTLRPSSVIVIDSYPLPSYITSMPSGLNPPIRFLCTSTVPNSPSLHGTERFAPPNIIQSTAASFLAMLESPVYAIPATLLLLPSAHLPSPVPRELQARFGPDLREEWEASTLVKLHKVVCAILGKESSWQEAHLSSSRPRIKLSRKGDIGEGSMYI